MADLLAEITRQIGSAPSSDQQSPRPRLPAAMAAKYERLRVVGRGSFGEAVLVRELASGTAFISKEVGMAAMSVRDRQEAINEVRFLSSLSHRNIIQYVESFLHNNVLYIVMEYADGGDLWELIQARYRQGKRLEEAEVLSYFTQVCMALKYMHDRKMLHRDLKTGNVFLTADGVAKLGDFGISTVMTTTMGLANTVCGTPQYFSPELCQGRPYNNKADIWALGCILVELMSGRLAFEGGTLQELYTKILSCELRPLPECYSPELRSLCQRIFCQQQGMRPTATALLRSYVIVGYLKDLKAGLDYQDEDEEVEASGSSKDNGAVAVCTPKRTSPQKAKGGFPTIDDNLEDEMEHILQELEGPRTSPKKPEPAVRSPKGLASRPSAAHHSMQVEQLLEELQQVGIETDLTFGDALACPSVEAFSRTYSNLNPKALPREDPGLNDSISVLIEEEMRRLAC